MSAGGQEMLVELLHELARQRAIAQTVQAARRDPHAEFFIRQRAAVVIAGLPCEKESMQNQERAAQRLPVSRGLIVNLDLDLLI